jgi:hypothetical protein
MCNGPNRGFERCRDLSSQLSPRATIFRVTKERWAQIGITTEFLIVVRTLAELFRLRHALGTNFSTAVATPYVGGGLIAACSCWVAVTLYFFRRYTLSAWIALATVVSSRSADSVETRADQAGQLSGMAIYHQSAGANQVAILTVEPTSTQQSIRNVAHRNTPPSTSRWLDNTLRRRAGSRSAGPARTRNRLQIRAKGRRAPRRPIFQ